MIPKAIREALYDARSRRTEKPKKGVVPPHLRRFLFKKGHRKAGTWKALDPKKKRTYIYTIKTDAVQSDVKASSIDEAARIFAKDEFPRRNITGVESLLEEIAAIDGAWGWIESYDAPDGGRRSAREGNVYDPRTRKVLDPKSPPRRWFEAMVHGIMKSSDVGEGEARGHAHRIWRTLSPQDRRKAGHTKRYDLPLPQDAHHSGGVIRVIKPFNLAEAQIDVCPKVFEALARTGIFQRMRRGDGTVGLVKRAKSNKGNVNIFVDRRR